jgi:hypothetical protein
MLSVFPAGVTSAQETLMAGSAFDMMSVFQTSPYFNKLSVHLG